MTTPERNKEIVRSIIRDGVNQAELEPFRAVLTEDYRRHSQATTDRPEIRGVEEMCAFLEEHFSAFPDWREEIRIILAEGDLVALLTRGTGTQTGAMGDIPPTGKSMEVDNFIIHRLEGGRIAETWVGWDNLTALVQLGLFPPPGGA